MQQERLKTIKNAWTTKDYALKIIADLEQLKEEAANLLTEVLTRLKVNDNIFEHSAEFYVGNEQDQIDF